METTADFECKGTELVRYKGPGGAVTIPDGVTKIGYEAFSGCTTLTRVTLSESVEEVSYRAFFGCSNLTQMVLTLDQLSMSQRMFQPNAKTVELLLRMGDGEPLDVIASFRKEY